MYLALGSCSSSTFANSTSPAVPQILAKAEFLNPGGSVKDRVALTIVKEAIDAGDLKRGGLITEGTAGSTGVPHDATQVARGGLQRSLLPPMFLWQLASIRAHRTLGCAALQCSGVTLAPTLGWSPPVEVPSSAGVSLAVVANSYGCRCHIAMPDDAALEKAQMLEALGEQPGI